MDDDDYDEEAELPALRERIAKGPPPGWAELEMPPPPPPMYHLSVDTPDEKSIVLVVGQSGDGIWRAMISLPQWYEIPEMWEGPYEMDIAIPLVNSYAAEYGYHAIAIDIESSQLWQGEWGDLQTDFNLDDH